MRPLRALVMLVAILAIAVVTTAAKQVEISFLTFFATKDEALARSIVADFEKANPDIKVNLEITPSYKTLPQQVLVRTAGGTAPDVIDMHPSQFYELASQGVLLDITALARRDIDLNDFFPPVLESVSLQQRLYALPQRISTYVLFYNRDMFAESGLDYPTSNWRDTSWNWDTFYETSKRLRRDVNNDGLTDRWGAAIGTAFQEKLMPFFFQAGNPVFDPGYSKFLLGEPSGIRAIEYVAAGIADGAFSGNYGSFGKGTSGMVVDIPPTMISYKATCTFDFDVAPLPQGPAGPGTTIQPIPVAVVAHSKNQEAAWRFLQYYVSKEVSQRHSQAGVVVQPRRSVTGNTRYYPDVGIRDLAPFLGALEVGRPVPNMHPKFPEIADQVNAVLDQVFKGTLDPRTGLESIKGPVEELLKTKAQ